MLQEELTEKIIGCAMRVRRALGAGFLESIYQSALLVELRIAGLDAEAGTRIPAYYRDELVGDFMADILVGKAVILELKAVQEIHPAHESQLVNYLQPTGLDIGLFLNFGAPALQIKRKHRIYKSPPVHPENPVILSKNSAFTLLELMVAMAVMAVLLLLLLNMVDSGAKLWRVNENRVDSYREARAALGIMARDLQNALAATNNPSHFSINSSDVFSKLPAEAVKDTNMAAGLFFLSALPLKAQEASNKSDVCQVGYFLAFGKSSSASNSPVNTMNLYRYLLSSDETFKALQAAAGGGSPFTNNLTITSDLKVELLARNVTRFAATAYTFTSNSLAAFSPSTNTPLPDLLEISVSAINQDAAKKLGNTSSTWTSTNSPLYTNVVSPVEQTFTTRIKINRSH